MAGVRRIDSKIVHVLGMTAVSGCADAIGFLALGQVLVAAMTGNTVFLGLAVVHAGGLQASSYFVALGGFMLGAAIAAFGLRNRRLEKGLSLTVTRTLLMQWAALTTFGIIATVAAATSHPAQVPVTSSAVGTSGLFPGTFTHGTAGIIGTPTSAFSSVADQGLKLLLILLLTFGMGVQGAVARRIGINGIPTTVITSLTTGLMESLVWNACGPVVPTGNGADRAVGPGQQPPRPQPGPHTPPAMIAVWITDIFIYALGAAVCGALILRWHLYAIWLPVLLVTLLIAFSFASQRRSKPRLGRITENGS